MHADQVAARRHNEDQKDALRGRLGNNAETEVRCVPIFFLVQSLVFVKNHEH